MRSLRIVNRHEDGKQEELDDMMSTEAQSEIWSTRTKDEAASTELCANQRATCINKKRHAKKESICKNCRSNSSLKLQQPVAEQIKPLLGIFKKLPPAPKTDKGHAAHLIFSACNPFRTAAQ